MPYERQTQEMHSLGLRNMKLLRAKKRRIIRVNYAVYAVVTLISIPITTWKPCMTQEGRHSMNLRLSSIMILSSVVLFTHFENCSRRN